MNKRLPKGQAIENLPLSKAAQLILDESRMLLPSIQALFGFQLIAVFNQTFSDKLNSFEQQLHLLAIGLVVLTTITIMTPAAYHRQTSPLAVSTSFITLASRLLLWAMIPLMVGIGLDFYLIARMILANRLFSLLLAIALVSVFSGVWFVLPRVALLQRLVCGKLP